MLSALQPSSRGLHFIDEVIKAQKLSTDRQKNHTVASDKTRI